MRCPHILNITAKYTGEGNRIRLVRGSLKVQCAVPRGAGRDTDNVPLMAEFINMFIEKRK